MYFSSVTSNVFSNENFSVIRASFCDFHQVNVYFYFECQHLFYKLNSRKLMMLISIGQNNEKIEASKRCSLHGSSNSTSKSFNCYWISSQVLQILDLISQWFFRYMGLFNVKFKIFSFLLIQWCKWAWVFYGYKMIIWW